MNKIDYNWVKWLLSLDHLDLFSLCKDFENLSLNDKKVESSSSSLAESSSSSLSKTISLPSPSLSSSSSKTLSLPSSSTQQLSTSSSSSSFSYGYSETIHHILNCWKVQTPWCQDLSRKLKAPFIELPNELINKTLFLKPENMRMALGFRFFPGQSHFLLNEINMPPSFEKLKFISHSLGLRYIKSFTSKSGFSRLHSLVTNHLNRVLIEVITQYGDITGRYLILVSTGIGCTVWYTTDFAMGSFTDLTSSHLSNILSYDLFFNPEYECSNLLKVEFLEIANTTSVVADSFTNEETFADIKIPANGVVLAAVGLGIMVACLLSAGVVPGH